MTARNPTDALLAWAKNEGAQLEREALTDQYAEETLALVQNELEGGSGSLFRDVVIGLEAIEDRIGDEAGLLIEPDRRSSAEARLERLIWQEKDDWCRPRLAEVQAIVARRRIALAEAAE